MDTAPVTLGRRGRRAAARLARAVPRRLAALSGSANGGAGSPTSRARRLIDAGEAEAALALLSSGSVDQHSPMVHALRAAALMILERNDEARAAVLAAFAAPTPPAQAVLSGGHLARRLDDAELQRQADEAAVRTAPTTQREADRIILSFRSTDPQLIEAFMAAVPQWPVEHQEVLLEEIPLRARLSTISDPDEVLAELIAAAHESAGGLRLATTELSDAGQWDALTEIYRSAPAEPAASFAVKRITAAATKARKAGHLEATAALCEALIRSHPDQDEARELHRVVTDQIAIARAGWPVDVAAPEPAYVPRRDAVLSVLAQSLPHRSGGYATRSHGILTGLRDRGWDMTAATRLGFPYDRWPAERTDEVEPFDVVDGVRYTRLLEPGERTYDNTPMASYIERFANRIEEQARAHEAALIHASSFQNNGLAGLRAARRLGIPFVYEMRGLEDLMKISRDPAFGETSSYRYMTSLETHIAQQADLTFVITEALRDEMIRRGAPADRLVVLPNGVHTAQFEPRQPDEALLDELGLRGKTVIGYAGGLVDYEGLDLLLEAIAMIKAERDDFALIIVGDGHMSRLLRRQAEQLDITDVVTFTGRVPHSEVARYLSVFQITPFPRLPLPVCELISPIKPFESMAMGKAVISSSVAALTEIVASDERGLVFDKGDAGSLADALRLYLDDPSLREQMGRQARQWVLAERDWSDVCGIVDAAYHRLLD